MHRRVPLATLLPREWSDGEWSDGEARGSRPVRLSVLKADAEGAEYEAFSLAEPDSAWRLCAAGSLRLEQLNLEVHFFRSRAGRRQAAPV